MKDVMKAVVYFIYYVLFQIIILSGIAAFMVMSNRISGESGVESFMNNNVLGLTIISNILTILILFIFFYVRKKKLAEEINLQKVKIKKIIMPSIIAFSYSTAFALITYSADFENAKQIQNCVTYYSNIVPHLGTVIQIITLIIIAPVTEETICRGLVLTRLQRRFNNIIAVLISGLLFGIMHAAAGGLALIAGAAVMGIIFGIICVKTGSLLPAAIAHSAANIPDFIIALFPEPPDGVRYALTVLLLLFFAAMMYLFAREDRKSKIIG